MRFAKISKRVHITVLITIVFSLLIIHITKAVSAEPGTPEDPLVSQSYVDLKISEVTGELNNLKQLIQGNTQNTALEARVKALETDVAALKQQSQGGQAGQQGSKYEVIGPISPGKQIIAGESTEIVLRGGTAVAISSEKGGVADLITGTDLTSGQNVPLNHLLLIPRNDGRGISITGINDAWVLIRGSYTIR